MADFQAVLFTEATRYTTGTFHGVLGTEVWADLFMRMRNHLVDEGASEAEQHTFRDGILAAIDAAPETDLKANEKEALRNILLTCFDGVARMYLTSVAPKAQFLRLVQF